GSSDHTSSGPSRESGAVRVMTTGIQLTDDTIKRLNKLGAKMTTKPNDCTHLVTKGIVRTEKFLCAIACSPFVLTEGWVNSSVQAGKLLPETDFLISDPESERKWNFKLSTSLERAKREDCGEGLLKGMSFYVTPKVDIDLKLLKAVVASAGGQIQTAKPTVRILKANENRHVISCPADQSIWRPLVEDGYTIYSTELILLAVLAQEIRWKDDNCISCKPSS
ncbi:BRCT domain-containing protein, partial [Suillus paluster]|uniref:BRCT domain-containing protein n=1 Tax=Suillus paluster TaxID=48578 RepID=UPI001B87AFB6